MVIEMNDARLVTLAQVREFLRGSADVVIAAAGSVDHDQIVFPPETTKRERGLDASKSATYDDHLCDFCRHGQNLFSDNSLENVSHHTYYGFY